MIGLSNPTVSRTPSREESELPSPGAFEQVKSSWLEIYGAKLWNVANESKSFVVCTLLVGVPFILLVDPAWRAGWGAAAVATLVAGARICGMTCQKLPLVESSFVITSFQKFLDVLHGSFVRKW